MTPCIPKNACSWLVDWSVAPIKGNTKPPRDPNDEDDDEDNDEDAEPGDLEPAVVREPDE